VEDRPGVECRFHVPEHLFNLPEFLVLQVDDAVGFEKYLTLLEKCDGQQFLWIGSSLRVLGKP
jgi:hypothetical protein